MILYDISQRNYFNFIYSKMYLIIIYLPDSFFYLTNNNSKSNNIQI